MVSESHRPHQARSNSVTLRGVARAAAVRIEYRTAFEEFCKSKSYVSRNDA
jgi:hypothetical protein